MENGSANSAHYDFVDRFDALGVGKHVPIATGNLSEGLLALVGVRFLALRMPYPMGYYAKGLGTVISTRAPFHMEGSKRTTSKLVKFQMRPDPLAE